MFLTRANASRPRASIVLVYFVLGMEGEEKWTVTCTFLESWKGGRDSDFFNI